MVPLLLRFASASIFAFCLSISLTFGQPTVYVTEAGAGNQSGSSWGNALPGVQLRNDPFTWQFQQVPGATDAVLIRHRVALPFSYTGNVRQVRYDAGGQVVFLEGAKIKFN